MGHELKWEYVVPLAVLPLSDHPQYPPSSRTFFEGFQINCHHELAVHPLCQARLYNMLNIILTLIPQHTHTHSLTSHMRKTLHM